MKQTVPWWLVVVVILVVVVVVAGIWQFALRGKDVPTQYDADGAPEGEHGMSGMPAADIDAAGSTEPGMPAGPDEATAAKGIEQPSTGG